MSSVRRPVTESPKLSNDYSSGPLLVKVAGELMIVQVIRHDHDPDVEAYLSWYTGDCWPVKPEDIEWWCYASEAILVMERQP